MTRERRTLADQARMLIAYNAWANVSVLDAMDKVSDADLASDTSPSRGSILQTMQHVLTAQAVWLARFTGAQPPAYDLRSREGMRAACKDANERLTQYAESFTDADWDRVLEYRDSSGNAQAEPMGVLITHVVNHGTLHRGEAGMLLAGHGHSPGDLDYVYWARANSG